MTAAPAAARLWGRGPAALLLALVLLLAGCGSGYDDLIEKRQKRAADSTGDVIIAVVQSSDTPNLTIEGAQLAAEIINDRGGVLGGRRIVLRLADDHGDMLHGEDVIHDLAWDFNVCAVVGHVDSRVAVPAAIVYGEAGLLFISTGATDPQFNLIVNNLNYRTVPSNREIGWAMAEAAKELGLRNVVILFEIYEHTSLYGKSLSEAFNARAVDLGVNVVHTSAFFQWQKDLRPTMATMQDSMPDGLVLIADMAKSADIINQARGLGFDGLILGGDALYNPELPGLLKSAPGKTVAVGFYNPDDQSEANRDFVAKFQKKFGKRPDQNAASAFDAINLLAQAMTLCQSNNPLEMAMALRVLRRFPGATGEFTFRPDGDVLNKTVYFFQVEGEGFKLLRTYRPDDVRPATNLPDCNLGDSDE